MGCSDFSSVKVDTVVRNCRRFKASLWLRHTKEYSYINAYNLAVMATLAYSRVDPNKHGEGIVEIGDVADFYDKCFQKMPFPVTHKEYGGATPVRPLFRYAETKRENSPLIEPNENEWFVDTPEKGGNSTEAFFFVDDLHAVLSIRGTAQMWQDGVVIDGDAAPVEIDGIRGYLHRGFATQAQTIMKDGGFQDFMEKAGSRKLFVTGHSLGGAVATILAAYLKEQGHDPLLYTYGSPRVGNETFVQAYSSVTHYRHVYRRDPIPMVPTRRLFISTHDLSNPSIFHAAYTTYSVIKRYLNPDIGDYLHHGTLCQIARVGGEDMILPFESHGIVGEHLYRKLTQKSDAQRALKTEKEPAEWVMENGGSQAQQYLLDRQRNLDLAKSEIQDAVPDGAMVGDLDLLQLQDAWGKIDVTTSGTDHFMKESYLPFFEREVRRLWRIYRENGCKEVEWYAGRRYDRALASIEERLQKLKYAQAHSANRLKSVQALYRKQIRDLEAARKEVLSYKQKKIGTKSLYSLYTGDPELNRQLKTF